jgi:myo-inositol-1(or 4)-monophosphatase
MNVREAVREAVLAAGELVAEAFGGEERDDVEQKGMNDFVTGIDRKSEEIIKKILGSYFPDIPFLAEESSSSPAGDRFWVIDPLDGTTNFIHGYQQVGISVALLRRSVPVLGMVLDPLRGELFEAAAGEGSRCNGEPIEVSGAERLENSLIGTGFPFRAHQHMERYFEVFNEIFPRCSGMRRAGAAVLDLCHTAAGRLDGFWELYLKPWDMAAGALIVTEAGGKVTDFFGTGRYLSAGNIVAAPAALWREIQSVTESHFLPEQIEDLSNDLIG